MSKGAETDNLVWHVQELQGIFESLDASELGLAGTEAAARLEKHLPFLQTVLRTEPVSLTTWMTMIGLALTVFVAMEVHKWTWAIRHRVDRSGE
jgi:hypothetical protein